MDLNKSLGLDKYIKPFLFKELPRTTGWSAVLGTLCALTFGIMVITGMILAFYYVPDPDKAYLSVQYISNEVPLGKVLRGLHHWGAGAMVFLVFCHLLVSYMHGSYQAPRQFTWLTGACLFVVVLGLGFTGYLLPWDMKAYWATVVGANLPEQFPLVGSYITKFIVGGENISGFTLTRFYSVHTLILPACLVAFMAMHIYLIRVHNLSDPRERIAGEKLPSEEKLPLYRFYPEHMNRTAVAFMALFVALLLAAACIDPPFEQKAGTFIADYLPRPEWYYMWMFQLLTYFTGAWELIGTILLVVGGMAVLFGVPFFSESQLKGVKNRPVSLAIATTFVVCMVYLTVIAYAEASAYNKIAVVPNKELTAEQKNGLFVYVEQECSYCHNTLGQGGHRTGPDMSNMVRKGRTARELMQYVKDPASEFSSTTMPAYTLTDKQLKDLADFLLTLDFRDGVEPVVRSTKEILEEGKKAAAK